jgi:hypothetical protein
MGKEDLSRREILQGAALAEVSILAGGITLSASSTSRAAAGEAIPPLTLTWHRGRCVLGCKILDSPREIR